MERMWSPISPTPSSKRLYLFLLGGCFFLSLVQSTRTFDSIMRAELFKLGVLKMNYAKDSQLCAISCLRILINELQLSGITQSNKATPSFCFYSLTILRLVCPSKKKLSKKIFYFLFGIFGLDSR